MSSFPENANTMFVSNPIRKHSKRTTPISADDILRPKVSLSRHKRGKDFQIGSFTMFFYHDIPRMNLNIDDRGASFIFKVNAYHQAFISSRQFCQLRTVQQVRKF